MNWFSRFIAVLAYLLICNEVLGCEESFSNSRPNTKMVTIKGQDLLRFKISFLHKDFVEWEVLENIEAHEKDKREKNGYLIGLTEGVFLEELYATAKQFILVHRPQILKAYRSTPTAMQISQNGYQRIRVIVVSSEGVYAEVEEGQPLPDDEVRVIRDKLKGRKMRFSEFHTDGSIESLKDATSLRDFINTDD